MFYFCVVGVSKNPVKIVSGSCNAVSQPARREREMMMTWQGLTLSSGFIVIPETENIIAVKRILSVSPGTRHSTVSGNNQRN